ncbi:MAG: cell division protein FtsQ/DivIB [Methylophilales bacterium]|nr:cell division protein FtsQ/DivIB [Methylophilales bacterium]
MLSKTQMMLWAANLLYAMAALLFLYALLFVVLHLPIYPLKHVEVNGELTHVTREQLKLITGRYLQGNFFTVDLVQTRNAFEKLPWVRNVSVRRRWPDKLEVLVEEHRELARWGDIGLVNTHGELFHAASDKELPFFYGAGESVKEIAQNYQLYGQVLSPTGLKVTRMSLSSRRAWQMTVDNGMVIELGREQMEARLKKFAQIYAVTPNLQNSHASYADLRYPNGFAVRRPVGVSAHKVS